MVFGWLWEGLKDKLAQLMSHTWEGGSNSGIRRRQGHPLSGESVGGSG